MLESRVLKGTRLNFWASFGRGREQLGKHFTPHPEDQKQSKTNAEKILAELGGPSTGSCILRSSPATSTQIPRYIAREKIHPRKVSFSPNARCSTKLTFPAWRPPTCRASYPTLDSDTNKVH